MKVEEAERGDIGSWLEIVREVEPLFGPMPDFEATLVRKIAQKAALCVREEDRTYGPKVLGGMLLGGRGSEGWIRWLAVRATARRRGIGERLVAEAVGRLAGADAILLDTFREENVEGRPARRLYERMGFAPGPLLDINGAPRQRYERCASAGSGRR